MPIHALTEDAAMTRIDGRYDDGGGLWLIVRNNGAASSYFFEYNGKLVGEDGWESVSLGARKKTSLKKARDRAELCRNLIDRGISPRSWRNEERKQLRKQKAADMTVGKAMEEFYQFAQEKIWHSPSPAEQARTVMRNYFRPSAIWNRPVQEVEEEHAAKILDPIWFKKPAIAKRVQSFGFSVFKWLKLHKLYLENNPFDGSRYGPLVQMLGGMQPPGGNFEDPELSDVQLLMAHLRAPPRHGDDVCTTAEAVEATGRDYQTIRKAIRRGLFPGAYKWADWGTATWLIPVKELPAAGFPLQRPLRHHIEISEDWYALQFVLLTVVRSDMAANLRWDQIKTGRGLIVFQDTQHKMGRQNNEEYNVVITPAVSEILEAMDAQQKRYGIKSDYVFVHPPTRTGIDRFTNQRVKKANIWNTMKLLLAHIPEIEKRDATVHGVRATFTTFAADNGHSRDHINAVLGHRIPGQTNKAYFRNAKYLMQARKIRTEWEVCILQVPPDSIKVIPLRSLPSIKGK